MGNPWPAPDADDVDRGDSGQPNYGLRRALVAGAAVAVMAGGVWFVLGRGSDGEQSTGSGASAWDTVVLQRTDGSISVVDRDGDELASATSDLVGVTDIGIAGKVLLGLTGDPATDGLGVLSLEDGSIDDIDVEFDQLRRLGRTPLLVASDNSGTGLELVDLTTGTTTDLLDLADGDDPLADALSARANDEATHVAFTELRSAETIVVDVAERTGATLPGALADLAFDRVLTITNRGDTVLLDLSDVTGTLVGTVETAPVLTAMLVDASTAVVVTADGVVSRVDFDEEVADEITRLGAVLPLPPGTDIATDPEIIDGAGVLADHTRMVLFGDRFVAFVDDTGTLVRSVDVANRVAVYLDPVTTDQCLSVGDGGGPYTLLDARTGVIVTAFDDGALLADSEDGCVVAFSASGAGAVDVVAGVDTDRRLDDRILALSADGTAALQASTTSIGWVDLTSGDSGAGAGTSADATELLQLDTGVPRVSAASFATR